MVWLQFDVESVEDGATMTFPFALGVVTFLTVEDGDADDKILFCPDLAYWECLTCQPAHASSPGWTAWLCLPFFLFDCVTTGVASSSMTRRPTASLTGSATLLRRLRFTLSVMLHEWCLLRARPMVHQPLDCISSLCTWS